MQRKSQSIALLYAQAIVALCLTLNVSAAFSGAFVVEYDENIRLVRRSQKILGKAHLKSSRLTAI